MKLGFAPSIGPFDLECEIAVTLEWELGSPHLIIDGVYDIGSNVNLLLGEDVLLKDMGLRIADMAEDDERLLARAVEQDEFERAAA